MVNKILNKIVFVSIVFFVGVVVAYASSVPNPGHGGDSVLVVVDDYKMTLQEAINNGFLVDGASSPTKHYTGEIPNPGHSAEHIFVSVGGDEKTLQQAISSSLCGSGSYSYSSGISFGHSADEILVSVGGSEMNFQDAIDDGEFCIVCTSHASSACYDNDVYWYDSCGDREEKMEECGAMGCSEESCVTISCGTNKLYAPYIGIGYGYDHSAVYDHTYVGHPSPNFIGNTCTSGTTPLYACYETCWEGEVYVNIKERCAYSDGTIGAYKFIGYACDACQPGAIPLYLVEAVNKYGYIHNEVYTDPTDVGSEITVEKVIFIGCTCE